MNRDADTLAAAAALLRRGVLIPARPEDVASLGRFLTHGLGLEPAYAESRIQTILRNGLAVDGFDVALIDRDRLALSAAMPGVAGAALRRGGYYAALRAGITQGQGPVAPAPEAAHASGQTCAFCATPATIWIELRCYNSIAEDLAGPLLLRGLAARPENADATFLAPAIPPLGITLPSGFSWFTLPRFCQGLSPVRPGLSVFRRPRPILRVFFLVLLFASW